MVSAANNKNMPFLFVVLDLVNLTAAAETLDYVNFSKTKIFPIFTDGWFLVFWVLIKTHFETQT